MRISKMVAITCLLLAVIAASTLAGCQKTTPAPADKQVEKSNSNTPASSNSPAGKDSSSGSASNDMPQNGLVLHYKFDETNGTTAKDSSPSGKNATVHGASFGSGKNGNALILDGVDDYVEIPEGVVSGLKKFTFSVWVNLNSLSATQKIFDISANSARENFLKMALNGTTGRIRFGIKANASEKERVALTPDAVVTTNKWAHIAFTGDGNTGILYIDGVKQAEITDMGISPGDLAITTTNYIGKSANPNDLYLGGKMDDFAFYNRVLTAEEIAKIAK